MAFGKVDAWSQAGCAMTHQQILQNAVEHGLAAYMACEDDLVVCGGATKAKLNKLVKQLTAVYPFWSMLHLGVTKVELFSFAKWQCHVEGSWRAA